MIRVCHKENCHILIWTHFPSDVSIVTFQNAITEAADICCVENNSPLSIRAGLLRKLFHSYVRSTGQIRPLT
jgi:hypothetical protein